MTRIQLEQRSKEVYEHGFTCYTIPTETEAREWVAESRAGQVLKLGFGRTQWQALIDCISQNLAR
jgi:hypothetical protein